MSRLLMGAAKWVRLRLSRLHLFLKSIVMVMCCGIYRRMLFRV